MLKWCTPGSRCSARTCGFQAAASALWVEVDSDDFDPRAQLCPLLEADPDLRASRVQLQAPPGSTRPVRFLQCRVY